MSLYLLLVANWPLWLELARIGGAPSLYLTPIAIMAVLVLFGTAAVLALTAWTRGMKPVWFAVVLVAAATAWVVAAAIGVSQRRQGWSVRR